MKKNSLTHLLLLTSVAFFTACSHKTPEKKPDTNKPKLTALDIIGIDVSTAQSLIKCTPSIDDLPLAKTYPIEEQQYHQDTLAQLYPLSESEILYMEEESQPKGCVMDLSQLTKKSNNHRSSTMPNAIESRAKKLLGHKYVWGATGPNTYDCSGFTQKIYRDAGINIPRVSRDQAKVGKYVSFNNLRKGDMVFFDTHKPRSGKVTHVGIYLGNGNFIHASSAAKKIVIFNFNEKTYYKKRFLWGRRVIQNNTRLASL